MKLIDRIFSTLSLTVLFASLALQASAATIFLDDFSDGSVTNDLPVDRDGNPVIWTEIPTQDGYDATSGDYVLTPTTDNVDMSSTVVDITLEDFSIRAQVRTSIADGGVFVVARVQEPSVFRPRSTGYFGGIEYRPGLGGTVLYLGRADGGGNNTFFGDRPLLPFDVRTEDAVLQLDVIDNELKLWGWKAGDPMPDQPQLSATDSTYSEGTMRIISDAQNLNISTFRYVHVADEHIVPEPTTFLLAMLGMAGTCCYRRRR